MHKRTQWTLLILLMLFLLALPFVLSQALVVRSYSLESAKLSSDMHLMVVADLHNSDFGQQQAELIAAIRAGKPDVILIPGDVSDGLSDLDGIVRLIQGLDGAYPLYYVSGNHENWMGEADAIKARLRELGVRVLEGESEILTIRGERIRISGLDDPIHLTKAEWKAQLEALRAETSDGVFTVLMSHRPERFEQYGRFDLTVAGHAHGGQVRIPGLINGLWAPNQGWFPKYAGGEYADDDAHMIVSRGLQKSKLPRVFNRPELVIIELSAPK